MKRIRLSILFSLFLVLTIFLMSCGSEKLPTSKQEKVQFAFNGVERSLKSNSQKNKQVLSKDINLKKIYNKENEDSLNVIYNAMQVDGDKTNNPEFGYNEPPMIQFQYLKALYEEIGNDFSFDKKYSYTLTGEIYYDFTTRQAIEDSKYLNQYNFDLSFIINIDENDIIIATVGFDITYTNGNDTHHQKMYARLDLDYDMNDTNPTYELTMNYIDDLLEYKLDDEKYNNNEYDYVKVEKNSIKEWRKFGICSPTNLTNYNNADFKYKYSALRGYKDSYKYKTHNSNEKDNNLKNAVIDILNLDDALSNYNAFYQKKGENNDKIKTIYEKFNKIFGRDIVNDIVYTGATEKYEEAVPTKLLVLDKNMNTYFNIYNVDNDIEINNIFSMENHPDIYYADNNDTPISQVNPRDLKYELRYGSEDNTVVVNAGDRISTCIIKYNNSNIIEDNYNSNKITLIIKDENYNFESEFYFTISSKIFEAVNDYYEQDGTPTFPKELEEYDIPKYDSTTVKYKLSKSDNKYELMVIDDNLDIDAYATLLGKNGYTLSENKYSKKIGDNIINVSLNKNDGNFTVDINIVADSGSGSNPNASEYWPYEEIANAIGVAGNYILQPMGNKILYEVSNNDGLIVTATGFTEEEFNRYIANLNEVGYVDDSMSVFKTSSPDGEYIYSFNINGNSTDLYIQFFFVNYTEVQARHYTLIINSATFIPFDFAPDYSGYLKEVELKQGDFINVLDEITGNYLSVNTKGIKEGSVQSHNTYHLFIELSGGVVKEYK